MILVPWKIYHFVSAQCNASTVCDVIICSSACLSQVRVYQCTVL